MRTHYAIIIVPTRRQVTLRLRFCNGTWHNTVPLKSIKLSIGGTHKKLGPSKTRGNVWTQLHYTDFSFFFFCEWKRTPEVDNLIVANRSVTLFVRRRLSNLAAVDLIHCPIYSARLSRQKHEQYVSLCGSCGHRAVAGDTQECFRSAGYAVLPAVGYGSLFAAFLYSVTLQHCMWLFCNVKRCLCAAVSERTVILSRGTNVHSILRKSILKRI